MRVGLVIMSERELNRIEVLSKVTQGRMTVVTAANVLGLSRRQVHRLLKLFRSGGPAAIRHKARGRAWHDPVWPGFQRAQYRDPLCKQLSGQGPCRTREPDAAGSTGVGITAGGHLEHAGGRLLCRGAERGHSQIWPARDHEHGQGKSVHVLRLDGSAPPIWRADLDGWERSVPRQYLHRAAMANPEIRVCLPACLGDRIRNEGGHPEMDDLLQPQTPTLRTWRQATSRGLLAEK